MGKKKASAQQRNHPPLERRVLIAYYLTLAAFFTASFFPQARLWGINWWAYYPLWAKFALLISGALVPLLVSRWGVKWSDPQKDISNRAYWLISLGLLIAFGLLFYLLRARTHFLGDGYQLLGTLSSDHFYVKFRNRGSMGLQYLLMSLLGGRSEARALLSYQITSIGSGLLFAGVLIVAAQKLLESNIERLLLVVCLASGGYMLLFFGYVENYALFAVAVLAYCVVGLLTTQKKISRWWILLPQVVAVFFHVFGVVFLPATLYLLAAGSPFGNWISSRETWVKGALAASVVVAAGAVFFYAYTASYFFRFSLVPLIEDRFTVEGYTLFSANHLLDYANLVVMLIPGLAVLLVVRPLKWRDIVTNGAMRFLLLASVCALGAAFIFDPHLGMPRDWDLFAFSCVPTSVLLIWRLLSDRAKRDSVLASVLVSALIMLLLLIARAGIITNEESSIALIRNYITLDRSRTTSSRFLVIDYYTRIGRNDLSEQVKNEWGPEIAINDRFMAAVGLADSGRTQEARPILIGITRIRPNMHEAWADLARCYYHEGMYDSALFCLQVADGMNPYDKNVILNMGLIYYETRRFDEAEYFARQAYEIDTLFLPSCMELATVYKGMGNTEAYLSFIRSITNRPNPPVDLLRELVQHYVQNNQFDSAAVTIKRGLAKGLDSASVRELLTKYPEIELR